MELRVRSGVLGGWRILRGRFLAGCSPGRGQQGAGFPEFVGGAGTPQAVGADLHKPFGQHVPHETPDEFLGGEGHVLELLGAIVSITKGDLAVVEKGS